MNENRRPIARATGVKRRTIVKGAAWALPVIAATTATPLVAASVKPAVAQNVRITASCWGPNILGVGASYPQFRIDAVGAPVLAGSTFNLVSTGLAGVSIGGGNGLVGVDLINNNNATITLKQTIPAGGSTNIRVTGVVDVTLGRTFTLSTQTIFGNENQDHQDDSDWTTMTGATILGVLVGVCNRK